MCLCKYSSLTLWVYGKKNMNIFVITRLAVLFKIQSIPYRAVCTLLTCTFVPLSGCSKNLYWMGSLHSRCPFPKARKGNKTASAEKMRSGMRGGVILHTRSPFIPWNKANKVWFGSGFFFALIKWHEATQAGSFYFFCSPPPTSSQFLLTLSLLVCSLACLISPLPC